MGEPVNYNCTAMLLPFADVALRDGRTGAPVCGPRVRVTATLGSRVELDEPLAEGRCSFSLFDRGPYAVHVDAPGYGPLDTVIEVPRNEGPCGQETVELELDLAPQP